MLTVQLVSSLEKCFPDSDIFSFEPLCSLTALKNQQVSFQLLYKDDAPETFFGPYYFTLAADGAAQDKVRVRRVEYITSLMPAYLNKSDDGYLRTTQGLYPDLLRELAPLGVPVTPTVEARSLWVDLLPGALSVGHNHLTLRAVHENGTLLATLSLTVKIVDVALPPQELIYTNWFHTDCLASYYGVEVFSEKYWRITENFLRCAVRNGMSCVLTPVLTPPLDTRVGGERPTVQLVDVCFKGGVYTFGFEKLDRFVDMAKRCGIRYFEISHLFTQWGAEHAPKVMAETDTGYRRIFGWDTDAAGKEYGDFLAAFLPALRAHLSAIGIADECFFHISDEPHETHLGSYRAASAAALPYLEGCTVIDALSNVEFYKQGLVKHPIPATNHIEPFLAEDIEDRWTYYCCGQNIDVSNRYFSMPGARTRYIGVQLWYFGIKGLLHWGYNFYYSQHSVELVNPFHDSTGCGFSPSGDCFSVYPGHDGDAMESMRILQLREGIEDMRALSLAESLCGREAVLAAITPITGEIRFDRCILTSCEMLAVRDAVNRLIASAVK